MLVIGHRGACGYEPENTLRSFQKAIELGAEMIELDVQLCKTGELVVIHDTTVNRTTNGKGRVSKISLKKLQSFNGRKGEKIPTLGDVFRLVDRRTRINIELKGKGTAAPVADLIQKYVQEKRWQERDFCISSFLMKEIEDFRKINKTVEVGLLFGKPPRNYLQLAEKYRAGSINFSKWYATKKIIRKIHSDNLKVYVYTVNSKKRMQKLQRFGADGIFTNYLKRAQEL